MHASKWPIISARIVAYGTVAGRQGGRTAALALFPSLRQFERSEISLQHRRLWARANIIVHARSIYVGKYQSRTVGNVPNP
eukprot:COSAG05_NODE_4002_length_1725_cov_1.950800_2_plen_81_part_00